MPWTLEEEQDALQATDIALISLPEWLERASYVTEEEYNANPFAEAMTKEFGNPFEKGLYYVQGEEEAAPEIEELVEDEEKPLQI
jgi:hypothetical protein